MTAAAICADYVLRVDSSGTVRYIQRFSAELSNDFCLRRFPFDHQVLKVVLETNAVGT
jgi:hypothetical protein